MGRSNNQKDGKEVRFISLEVEGDIQTLVKIFRTHKLIFWSRVFEEYRLLYKRLELDSNKNDKMRLKNEEGWENYSVFGSL